MEFSQNKISWNWFHEFFWLGLFKILMSETREKVRKSDFQAKISVWNVISFILNFFTSCRNEWLKCYLTQYFFTAPRIPRGSSSTDFRGPHQWRFSAQHLAKFVSAFLTFFDSYFLCFFEVVAIIIVLKEALAVCLVLRIDIPRLKEAGGAVPAARPAISVWKSTRHLAA